MLKGEEDKLFLGRMVRILQKYDVLAGNVKARVEIKRTEDELVPVYFLRLPEIEAGTKVLLEDIRDKLIAKIPIKPTEMTEGD